MYIQIKNRLSLYLRQKKSRKMKPTLVVLAAGMGSRYGALKQMDAFGPNGETIIDYSLYDAIEAGFKKVVFIIRESFRADFEKFFEGKLDGKMEVAFVTQELDKIPSGYDIHPERAKPWGTAHAVMMAKSEVEGPFAVINADDYYGKDAYKVLIQYFENSTSSDYAVVGYKLQNTLSDHGTVNRGVCFADGAGNLTKVEECIKIEKQDNGHIGFEGEENSDIVLKDETLVSMNLWGFRKSYFDHADKYFGAFLKENGMILKTEFFIPLLIDKLIKASTLDVNVLTSDANWFGVTYQKDKPIVIEKLNALIKSGAYPTKLWS